MAMATATSETSAGKGGSTPAPAAPRIDRSGWTRRMAKPGDEVFAVAKLSGFPAGTPVDFRIFAASGDPNAPLANLRGTTNELGFAWVEWIYTHDPIRVKEPRILFEAEAEGSKNASPVLVIVDSISLRLETEAGKPVGGKEVRLVDSLGFLHVASTTPEGEVAFERVACGSCFFTVKGWEIVGAPRPGEKKFPTGTRHTVLMREMAFTVEFESPKDGEVFLAGDKVAIKVKVRRAGQPWEGDPTLSANNGGRVTGGGTADQGTGKKTGAQPLLILPTGKDGDVEIQGKYDQATATVKVKVVRPVVTEVKFDGPDAFKLYDHKRGGPYAGEAAFNPDGSPKSQHAGAFKFGKKLLAKVKVATAEALTHPARIEVALVTPPVEDDGLPANGIDKMAGKPLTLRLASDKREAGVELSGGEAGTILDLESDRPLPNAVRSYLWTLDVRVNQKAAAGWLVSEANLPIWPKVGELRGVRVNAVFNEAKVGDGKDLDPAGDPLKRTEYDPFHVAKACAWAAGGFNLLMEGDRSIPSKIVDAVRHLRWPEDYEGLGGKPAAEHPRPANQEELSGDDIYPGGGKACASCKGLLEGSSCSRCGKVTAVETRCARCKTAAGPGTIECATCGMTFLQWADKAYRCLSCLKNVPGNMPEKAPGVTACPYEPGSSRVRYEMKCPGCEKFVDERALVTGGHVCEQADPTGATTEPTSKNWSFGVISNPTHPGGKSHQVASLVAAAMGVLGVKAQVLYLRPRPGGAVNTTEHDPVTRGADCFDAAKDWGRAILALVGLPVDKSRDGEYDGVKLHEEDAFVIDPRTKKRGLQKDAATTGHERRPPDPAKLRDNMCRCGHEYMVVSRRYVTGDFWYGGGTGQLTLAATPVKVGGELAVEVALPVALYGSAEELIPPYGGTVVARGPGGTHTKQLGVAQWKKENGLLRSNRLEFGPLAPGEYQLAINGFFNDLKHHEVFDARRSNGHAIVVVHTRETGKPLPETINESFHEVSNATLPIKTSGKLVVALVEGMLVEFENQPFYKKGHDDGPLSGLTVFVDGKNAQPLERGKAVEIAGVAAGDHKLTFLNQPGHANWRFRVMVVTNTIDTGAKPKPCPTCGAQPNWGYKCAKCGKEVAPDATGKHECGAVLDGVFAQSIIYPCPNCKKTVHDDDKECWGCGAKLEARPADKRFGQPAAGSASGGEKQDDASSGSGKGGGDGKKEEESTRPVGRFDLFLSTGQRGVLLLGPEGQPSFLNLGYFHAGFSREDVKDVKWEEKTKTLTFTRVFENRTKHDFKLVFEPDGSFAGTFALGTVKGGVRKEDDLAPAPSGTYDIYCTNRIWHGVLDVNGDGGGAGKSGGDGLTGTINFGPYHPGYGVEKLDSLKWDAPRHTLTFLRPGPNQRYWLTFRDGGRAFNGVFSHGTGFFSAEGTKR